MKDVCACYFPVDFEPDGSDQITRKDLTDGLNAALIAGLKSKKKIPRQNHSPVIIDLLLEKLHSDSKSAIDDSIELLKLSLPLLNHTTVDKKLEDLIKIFIVIVGTRQNDEKAQRLPLDGLRALGKLFKNFPDGAKKGLDIIYTLTGEYLAPPFKVSTSNIVGSGRFCVRTVWESYVEIKNNVILKIDRFLSSM